MTAPLEGLPCPCGGNGVEHWPDGSTRHYIKCDKCGRRTATYLASHGGSARDEWLSAVALPDELEVDDFVRKLRDFEEAYSTEFFAPLTEAEKDEMGGFLLSRVSAEMGRHLAKFLTQAADALSQAHSTIAALRVERDRWMQQLDREVLCHNEHKQQLVAAESEVKRLTEEKEALRDSFRDKVALGASADEILRFRDSYPNPAGGSKVFYRYTIEQARYRYADAVLAARATLSGSEKE